MSEVSGPFVPVSDMLIGLTAVLLVVLALASRGDSALAEGARQAADGAAADGARAAGATGTVLLATSEGVELLRPGEAPVAVPLDGIPGWVPPPLPDPLDLVVLADGMEADFLLGPVLARAGVGRIARLRVAGPCATLTRGPGRGLACGG